MQWNGWQDAQRSYESVHPNEQQQQQQPEQQRNVSDIWQESPLSIFV